MDNQQDQPGTPNPTNAGRNPQNQPTTPGTPRPNASSSDSTASGAAASSRKSAPMPNAQNSSFNSGSTNQNPTGQGFNGADHQGEGQQNNTQEGNLLDTALQSGKKWIENSGVLNGVNQLPQTLKDFGNRAVARVSDLSTTQKVVGGTLLAVGLGWLATRKGKSSNSSSPYNYGRANSGNFGREKYGYQAPDASTSNRTASGTSTSSRSDSGAAYGGNASRYGSTGAQSGSGTGFGASATTDHGAQDAKGTTRTPQSNFGSGIE